MAESKKPGKTRKILQGLSLSVCAFALLKVPLHHAVMPHLYGIDQALITDAIESSNPRIAQSSPDTPDNQDLMTRVFFPGTLAAYHARGNETWLDGDWLRSQGTPEIFGRKYLTHDHKDVYAAQEISLKKFWQRFELVETVELNPAAAKIKGLLNSQSFSAIAVRDREHPDHVYVIMPGAEKDGPTAWKDIKEGVDVMCGYANDQCQYFVDFLRRVEEKTGKKPAVISYSNSSTMGMTAAGAGYMSYMLEPIGLNPANLMDMMGSLRDHFNMKIDAYDAVQNMNHNSVAIHFGVNTKVYGYAAQKFKNSFCFIPDNHHLTQMARQENWFKHGSPLSKLHQLSWPYPEACAGKGEYYRITQTSATFLGVVGENMDFRGELVKGENPDSPVRLENAEGQGFYPRRSGNSYPVNLGGALGIPAIAIGGLWAYRRRKNAKAKSAAIPN